MPQLERYTNIINGLVPALATLICYIYPLSLPSRKLLLKACRIQGPFTSHSRLYQRYTSELQETIYMYTLCDPSPILDLSTGTTIWSLIKLYTAYFSNSVACGYISMLLRYLPYHDYSTVQDMIDETVLKELRASQGGGFTGDKLNFRSIFDHTLHVPYMPGVPSRNDVAPKLRGAFRRLSPTHYIVPRLGRKTLPLPPGHETFYQPYAERIGREIRNLRDVEEVFIETGVELYGRTKMKTVWRGNDLKPRVYYSRGASLHRSSTYIQQIFNLLVDTLSNTHRTGRHNTTSIPLEPDEILAIYDYSSFTSNLSAITKFTAVLADSFMGTFVNILDPHHGVISVSVGELIHEYNETCNRFPDFDASEVLFVEEAVFNHNAGMLGVPGNISSCTLCHGIHLGLVIQSFIKNKVVGDDAMLAAKNGNFDFIQEAIGELGDAARDKMESWEFRVDDDDFQDRQFDYKKRPVNRLDNVILTGNLIDFPSLVHINIKNPFHRAFQEPDAVKRKKAINAITTFADDLATFPGAVDDIGEEVANAALRAMYTLLRLNPKAGGRDEISGRHYPPIIAFGISFQDWIYHFSDQICLRLPVQYIGLKHDPDCFEVGQVFYRRSSALTSYLVAVGYLVDETEFESVSCRDLVDLFGVRLDRLYDSPIRKYVISKDLLYWMPSTITPDKIEVDLGT